MFSISLSFTGYGLSIGQNFAIDKELWDAAIQSWFDEVQYFKYNVGTNAFWNPVSGK